MLIRSIIWTCDTFSQTTLRNPPRTTIFCHLERDLAEKWCKISNCHLLSLHRKKINCFHSFGALIREPGCQYFQHALSGVDCGINVHQSWNQLLLFCPSEQTPFSLHEYSLIRPFYTAGEFIEAFLIMKCRLKLPTAKIHCNAHCWILLNPFSASLEITKTLFLGLDLINDWRRGHKGFGEDVQAFTYQQMSNQGMSLES